MQKEHKFMVTIKGELTRNEAQQLLKDIGGFNRALPLEEQLDFTVQAYPIQNKPTLIFTR